MDKIKAELLEKASESKVSDVNDLYEAYKRKKHETDLIWFKIRLMTENLNNLYYDDLPVSEKVMSILVNYAPCKDLLEFWTLGSNGIQLMLSNNGIHEDLPIVMKSVNRMIELIDQCTGVNNDREST